MIPSTSTTAPQGVPAPAPAMSTAASPRVELTPEQDAMMRDAARVLHAGGTQRDVAVYWKNVYNHDLGGIPDSIKATGVGGRLSAAHESASFRMGLSPEAQSNLDISMHAVQGLTAGFGDDAIGSILGLASGKGAQYGRDVYRDVLAQGQQDHPIVTGLANLAGGALAMKGAGSLLGLGAKGAAMSDMGRLGLNAAEGGGAGALYGAGEATGPISDRVKGAVVGGVAGLLLSPLVSAGAQVAAGTTKTAARVTAAGVGTVMDQPGAQLWAKKLQNMLPGGASAAAKGREAIAQAIVMDQGSIDGAIQWAKQETGKGLPTVLGDAGENTRSLIQASSGFRHPDKQAMIDDIFARQGDQGMRAIKQLFGVARLGYENAYEAADTHMAAARAQASPLYESAHAQEIKPTQRLLDLFHKEPLFQQAWESGRITGGSEDLAGLQRGLPIPPLELSQAPKASGLLSAAGAPVPASGPPAGMVQNKALPVRGLDYMKQELDEVIANRYKTDAPMSTRRASALRAELNSVLDDPALKSQVPEWSQARDIFRGEKEFVDAMQMGKGGSALNADASGTGQGFSNRPSAVVKRQLASLGSPGERTAYVIGAMQDLADNVAAKKGAGTDYATQVFGARTSGSALPNVLQNIRAIMPDQSSAQLAEDYLRGEAGVSLLAKTQMGSRTAPMGQAMADLQDAAHGGMLRGTPGTTIAGLGKKAKDKLNLGVTAAVSDEISNLALKGLNGPNELVAAINNLRPHAPTHSPAMAGTFGAALGTGVGRALSPAQP